MERGCRKVLIAVDGSEHTQGLVDYLSGIISAQHTELVLFHVMPKAPESFGDWEKEPFNSPNTDHLRKWEAERETQVRDLMRDIRRQLTAIGIPEYSIMISIRKVKEGIARDLLLEAQRGYDAILVGRSGFGGAGPQVLGSVAAKMAAKLGTVNLWLVGNNAGSGGVIIAMDSSESALRAVDHVSKMINAPNNSVRLVHVVRGITVAWTGKEKIFPEEYRQRLIEEAENQIGPAFDEAIRILVSSAIGREKISTKVISGVTSRAGAIFQEALREGYGTVVVGRKGLSGVEEFDMGRVTGKLIQLAGGIALWVVA
ncbi:MAG: universal stress protein [Syntrophobacteraceae bacterium]|jgi:nucleotide-binding universal stress UspA family protein